MQLQEFRECDNLIRARPGQTPERLQQEGGRGHTAKPAEHFISQKALPALRFLLQAEQRWRFRQEEQKEVQASLRMASLCRVGRHEPLQSGVEPVRLRPVSQQQQQTICARQLHRQLHRGLSCIRHMRAAATAVQVVPLSTLGITVLHSLHHHTKYRHAVVAHRYRQVCGAAAAAAEAATLRFERAHGKPVEKIARVLLVVMYERVQKRLSRQEGSRASVLPAEDLHTAHVLQHPHRQLLAHGTVEREGRAFTLTL